MRQAGSMQQAYTNLLPTFKPQPPSTTRKASMTKIDIEAIAREAGMESALNMGAPSCVWTEGCEGVSQQHLQRFAALLLEKAAQVCEGIDQAASSNAPMLCAMRIREMAAGMGG